MPTGKLQPELWNDREKAAGAQKIGANFEGGGGDGGPRIIKAAGAKGLGDERSKCIVRRWQRPQFIYQLCKRDLRRLIQGLLPPAATT